MNRQFKDICLITDAVNRLNSRIAASISKTIISTPTVRSKSATIKELDDWFELQKTKRWFKSSTREG
jgi:hypothetical protein